MVTQVKRALISVTEKTELVEFAAELNRLGIKVLSTGGTGAYLHEAGVPYKDVSEETGFPEVFGGRLKTIHPRIHGGILYRRGFKPDEDERKAHGINTLDLVVVNLYDFKGRTSAKNTTDEKAIEAIDIGGPAMIRAAAKNWAHVGIITSPEQYDKVLDELRSKGGLTDETRRDLAVEAFKLTARYDKMIADWFDKKPAKEAEAMPSSLGYSLDKKQEMRYGENPHQPGAFYILSGEEGSGLSSCNQLHGKELSFNNMLDADIALALPSEFEEPCVAILKHTTPSGVAIAETIAEAEHWARNCDPLSAFGGIVGMNRTCDGQTASQINKVFTEVVVAPAYTDEALNILEKKKNLRIIEYPEGAGVPKGHDIRRVSGGLLIQERDYGFPELDDLKVVTKRKPTKQELEDLKFAWKVSKYVKSNAVLFALKGRTMGIGAGQMSRVDAVRLARVKADDSKLDLKGTVLASDAFFPFADGLEQAAEAGATAVIQPGGSVRDEEVIAAANEHNIAMVFTGRRHFRHA